MKTQGSSQGSAALGAAYAIVAAAIFSTAGVIVRHIELPAWDVSFWRSAFLVVTMLPLLLWQYRRIWIDVRNAGPALLLSAVLLAGSFVAFILALGLAPVANVLIMFGATPFITAIAARLFLGEKLHTHTVLAMAAAVVGLGISVAVPCRPARWPDGGGFHRRALHERQLCGRPPSPRRRHGAGDLAGRRDIGPGRAALRPSREVGWAQVPWLLALGPASSWAASSSTWRA